MIKLTLSKIADVWGLGGVEDAPVSSYAIDSRLVKEGTLFFALEGETLDGHDFVHEAVERGAVGVVVSKDVHVDVQVLRVENVLDALQGLAAWVYRQKTFPVVGVTGSMGKTITKDFIAGLLGQKMRVAKTQKSWNSQRTLPLGILNCPGDVDVAVFEYAMSEKGQMRRLADMAPPDLGVLTLVGLVHAENFESKDAIEDEKRELLRDVVQAFVHYRNRDWPGSIRFGEGGEGPYNERHLNENYAAAREVCRYFGFEPRQEMVPLPEKRSNVVKKGDVIFYNDSYNANTDSFAAAFAACPLGKRQIAVIGSMGELGKFSRSCHAQVGELAKGADRVLCLGDPCQIIVDMLGDKATLFPNYERLLEELKREVQSGDVVLLKGSNVHALWRILEAF